MILVAPRVLAVAADWLNFGHFPLLRSLRSLAAIRAFSSANVWSLRGQNGQGKPLTSHLSRLTNDSRGAAA
jgi:hypothetical protein